MILRAHSESRSLIVRAFSNDALEDEVVGRLRHENG